MVATDYPNRYTKRQGWKGIAFIYLWPFCPDFINGWNTTIYESKPR